MENDSLISVIIPVYNCEKYLSEAINSVLSQAYHPIEIIVVDDGSVDTTARVAANFKEDIHYIHQPNSGLPAALNRGLIIARGNVIGFLDADDLWHENKLKLQIDTLAENPLAEIVLGRTQRTQIKVAEDGKNKFVNYQDPYFTLSLGSAVFKKSVFDKVGLFNQELHYAQDWDWFMRARELCVSMVLHQELVLFYRRHEHNMTNQIDLGNHYTIRMLKKSLERRRQQNDGVATLLAELHNLN